MALPHENIFIFPLARDKITLAVQTSANFGVYFPNQ